MLILILCIPNVSKNIKAKLKVRSNWVDTRNTCENMLRHAKSWMLA